MCLVLPSAAEASNLPAGRLFAMGCVEDQGAPSNCEVPTSPGISNGEALATSRDGRFVWSGNSSGVLWAFKRGAGGSLTPSTCYGDAFSDCPAGNVLPDLSSVDALATSSDGRSLYAMDVQSIGSGRLHVLSVLPDGRLSGGPCFDVNNECGAPNALPGLANARDVTVSPDGRNVYLTSGSGTDRVLVFNRAASGSLTYAGCVGKLVSACGASNTAVGLESPSGVAVSPDGKNVYVASTGADFGGAADGAVASLTRSANGSLASNGCVEQTGAPSVCASNGGGLMDPVDIAATTNAVYVVSRDGFDAVDASVVTLPRVALGALAYGSCFATIGSAQCGAGRTIPGISNPFDVAVAPDGTTIHTTALGKAGGVQGAVATFARAANGALAPAGCIGQEASPEACTKSRVLQGGELAIGISPDGANVYAGTGDGVAYLGREVAPSCRNTTAVVPGAAASIPLGCSDLNLDALKHTVAGGPGHGKTGAITDSAGTVRYTPTPGYVGSDSLSVRALGGSLTSGLGVVAINVTNARPSLTRLGLSRKRFRRGRKLPKASAKAKVGAAIRFRLSEPVTVTLSFERIRAGRKVGRRCRAPRRGLRSRKKCKRYVKVKKTVRVKGKTGRNSVRFQGRLSRARRLKAGRYRLTATSRDKQGLRSTRRRATFTLLR